MRQHPDIALLADTYGIVIPGAVDYISSQMGMDARSRLLMDVAPTNALQSQLVTATNAGIPAFLANYLDPELTRVLTAPCKFAEIFGERKKGDWTTKTAMFPVIESSGEVSSYGDYNNNGSVDANANYESRQSYHYQTFTRWGDLELEMAGLAKIDWAAEQNIASALVFNKAQNKTYALGVTGLANYGWLNDPSLNAALVPMTKSTSPYGTTWGVGTGLEIWTDILAMFTQAQVQLQGNVDMSAKMKLVMSPLIEPNLLKAMSNVYGTSSVEDFLKKAMPNCTVETAVEYNTSAGQLVQLFIESVDGQSTGFCAFTEKYRAHAIVRDTSSTHQKKSAGSFGAIVKIPAAIVQMIGV